MSIAFDELNELPRLFIEAFPDWRDLDELCVIRLGIEVNQRDIAEELVVVTALGGRADLIARLKLTHPAGRAHIEEFDRHLWNSITEGVAFAWAAESLPDTPAFTDDDGKPDLVAGGTWVEVKSVWESDVEREVMNRVAEASEHGTVIMRMASNFRSPHPVLLRKFED